MDGKSYEPPALTGLFYVLGGLCIIGAAYLAVLAAQTSHDGLYGAPAFTVLSWAPCASAVFSGLVCFAIGSALDHLARIDHVAERALSITTAHGESLQSALARIEAQMTATAPAARFYYQGPDGQSAGPVTLDELQRLAAGGTIGAATLFCQEGREDWQALAGRVTGNAPFGIEYTAGKGFQRRSQSICGAVQKLMTQHLVLFTNCNKLGKVLAKSDFHPYARQLCPRQNLPSPWPTISSKSRLLPASS